MYQFGVSWCVVVGALSGVACSNSGDASSPAESDAEPAEIPTREESSGTSAGLESASANVVGQLPIETSSRPATPEAPCDCASTDGVDGAASVSGVAARTDGVVGDASSEAVSAVPMLSATIDALLVEFGDDVLAYNGRPPMMDIFAGANGDSPSWSTLRVAVVPPSLSEIVAGEYQCGPGETSFIMLHGASGVFDTTTTGGPCEIIVESPGTQSGQVFSGSFSATLYTTDGARSVMLEHGKFFGIVP
jgi:hypothetical protein